MKLINKIKSYFTKKDNSLAHCYTDVNGNKYYILLNQAEMSSDRVIKLLEFNKYVELCLTKERVEHICKKGLEALNKQNWSGAVEMFNDLMMSNQVFTEEETLKNLATVFIYAEGEPVDRYEEYYQTLKKEQWAKDKEAKFFFVNLAWKTTKRYSDNSQLNLRNYLEQTQIINLD